eukprot:33840_1
MDTQQEMNEYPEGNESTKQRFEEVIQRHGSLCRGDAYLVLIPSNSEDTEWVRRHPILVNGTVEEHEALLDRFVVPDKAFNYKRDMEEPKKRLNCLIHGANGRMNANGRKKRKILKSIHTMCHRQQSILSKEKRLFHSLCW